MTEEVKKEKAILSERDFSMTLVMYDDGTFQIKGIKTTIGDIELIGLFTITLNAMQKKYSTSNEKA